jgi:hypothetical protein
MEVLASIVLFLRLITSWLAVKGVVASDRDVPKDEDVGKYKNSPMHNVLGLLLRSDLCFALIKASACSFSTIHGFQDTLGSISRHI